MISEVHNEDCMILLDRLNDNSVDLFCCDPPFGIEFQSSWRIETERFNKIANDDKPYIEWLPNAFKKLKSDGRLIMFYRYDVQDEFFDAIRRAGFEIKSQIIWDKVIHGLGDLDGQFAPQHELIVYATKGRYEFQNGRPKTIIRETRVDVSKQIHPNEKPINLIRKLIRPLTSKGDTVCDLFVGSGSSRIAASMESANYYGSEISFEHFYSQNERFIIYQSQQKLQFA